jgi:uncharacterized protein YegP (UPF0339 family)
MVKNPKYILKKTANSEFSWVLTAVNGEVILSSSETYVSKQGAKNGIESSKKNIADKNFERKSSSKEQPYFVQVAGNGETLAKSEMYSSVQACENGVNAVKRDAPIANLEDLTQAE